MNMRLELQNDQMEVSQQIAVYYQNRRWDFTLAIGYYQFTESNTKLFLKLQKSCFMLVAKNFDIVCRRRKM